jgi:hypothetical protein
MPLTESLVGKGTGQEVFPLPLRLCMLANTLLLVTDKKDISENTTLNIPERKTLQQGLDCFFERALHGKKIVDEAYRLRKLSGDIDALKMYGVALDVLKTLETKNYIEKTDDPGLVLKEYETSLRELIDSSKIGKDGLNNLQKLTIFFKTLREIQLEKLERPGEKVILPNP